MYTCCPSGKPFPPIGQPFWARGTRQHMLGSVFVGLSPQKRSLAAGAGAVDPVFSWFSPSPPLNGLFACVFLVLPFSSDHPCDPISCNFPPLVQSPPLRSDVSVSFASVAVICHRSDVYVSFSFVAVICDRSDVYVSFPSVAVICLCACHLHLCLSQCLPPSMPFLSSLRCNVRCEVRWSVFAFSCVFCCFACVWWWFGFKFSFRLVSRGLVGWGLWALVLGGSVFVGFV